MATPSTIVASPREERAFLTSLASGMAALGISPHVVEALLGHRSGTIKGVAAVYNRYTFATEQRHAVDAWARRLEAIVTGTAAANVVELKAGA